MSALPSGTVTFLFSDIEGSTRRWQDEPELMRALLVEHDAIWREVIEKHRGHLFKHTGDGVAAVFASAADACAAAVDAQARLAGVLPVRVGLHTGEAELRDGDYFGSTLNRCARLMGVAHGGQVVCSSATVELVRERDDLHDLGEHRLRDLSRAERVWQVGGGAFAALRSLTASSTNLPLQLSSFVGRASEVEAVSALLAEHRLVTLTGVGGVGKTRLAIEVGAEVLSRFADGVWVVELTPVADEAMVLTTIAEVLGVAAQTGEPLMITLAGRLKAKQLLAIVDNCEHVLGAVARLVESVVAVAPGVRVLATSREPLGIAAERVRAVPPLAETTEAVELFIERATQAGATIDDRQRPAIGEICVRLDGIPLAIELAAARARMLTPTQIAERLDQRFRLLTGGGRTAVERHRTLQATVSWSYELLDEIERLVFQRLSTLSGSFDLGAAEGIAAGGQVEEFEVLDAVGHLVDKSMVIAVAGAVDSRFRLLETLRQFGADRLAEQPDATEVQDRHAAYWSTRAAQLGRATGGTFRHAVLDAIDADIDNYRSAFAYLLATGRVDDAARGLLALGPYWHIRRTREGVRWYHQLLAQPDLAAHRRIRALSEAAGAEVQTGAMSVAERLAMEAVELADATGIAPPWRACFTMGTVAMYQQDPASARGWWTRATEVAVAGGQQHVALMSEAQRGFVPDGLDSVGLIEHHERLQAEVRRHGDPVLIATTAVQSCVVLYRLGRRQRARELAESGVEAGRRAGSSMLVVMVGNACAIDVLTGDVERARLALPEGIRVALDEGLTRALIGCLLVSAALAERRNDLETTATLVAAVMRYEATFGTVEEDLRKECCDLARAAVDAHIGDLTEARRRGEAMTIDEITDFALQSLR